MKTAADVYAPISGEVIAHNDNVKGDPALVNNSPETDGWMIRIRVEDAKDLGIC